MLYNVDLFKFAEYNTFLYIIYHNVIHINDVLNSFWNRGCCGGDRKVVGFITTYTSVPITINVVEYRPGSGEMYLI